MSISGVGGLNHYLTSLLSRLSPIAQPSTPAPGAPAPSTASASASGDITPASGTPPTQTLSDQILALLTQLQQISGSAGGTATASASTMASPLSSPLNQLVSAMDTDGDGEVSQSEMEAYVQKQGGTAAQADALFAGLNQGGTGNLTQTQLASDLQNAQGAGVHGGGHHHRHHHGMPSADQVGNDLVSAMDTDGDGSVDLSEFASFVSSLGGSSSEATTDFAALDPTNTGSVGAAQFSAAISAFENASQTVIGSAASATSPVLGLLDAFSQTPSTNLIA